MDEKTDETEQMLKESMPTVKDAMPSWFRPGLAILLIAASFLFFWHLLDVSDNKQQLIMLLFGLISAVVTTVVGYVFGSSQGSAQKQIDSQIAKIAGDMIQDKVSKSIAGKLPPLDFLKKD